MLHIKNICIHQQEKLDIILNSKIIFNGIIKSDFLTYINTLVYVFGCFVCI